jgi:hypothetical protein
MSCRVKASRNACTVCVGVLVSTGLVMRILLGCS